MASAIKPPRRRGACSAAASRPMPRAASKAAGSKSGSAVTGILSIYLHCPRILDKTQYWTNTAAIAALLRTEVSARLGLGPTNTGRCKPRGARQVHQHKQAAIALHRAHIVIAQQIAADFVAVVQLALKQGAQLGGIGHSLLQQAGGLFGQAQNNRATLGVGHGGIGLSKTAGHATACRFEFGGYALGAGLQGEEEVKLAYE